MNIQRLMLQLLSKLPDSVIRRMAGPPIEIRGRTPDPLMQLIWKEGQKQPHITSLEPEGARNALEDAAKTMQAPVPPGVQTEDIEIPGPAGPMPARVYTPSGGEGLPLTLFFHFGGFVIGSRHICEGFCGLLAERANTKVVNVEYRLAPEHPFPAPVEDALAAYDWAVNQADRVVVAGDSAGGMLAAVLAQEAKRSERRPPDAQVLIYPWLTARASFPSFNDYAKAYPLDEPTMEWFGALYFASEEEKAHPWADPFHQELTRLPPALVVMAGFDPIRDAGEQYAERLKEAGVPVTYRCYENLTHSFTMLGGVLPAAQRAMTVTADDLANLLRNSP